MAEFKKAIKQLDQRSDYHSKPGNHNANMGNINSKPQNDDCNPADASHQKGARHEGGYSFRRIIPPVSRYRDEDYNKPKRQHQGKQNTFSLNQTSHHRIDQKNFTSNVLNSGIQKTSQGHKKHFSFNANQKHAHNSPTRTAIERLERDLDSREQQIIRLQRQVEQLGGEANRGRFNTLSSHNAMYENDQRIAKLEESIKQIQQKRGNDYASFQQRVAELDIARKHDLQRHQAAIITLQDERDTSINKLNMIIREQQEHSFSNINTAKWTLKDETVVKGDLDYLKRRIKAVSKDLASRVVHNTSAFSDQDMLSYETCLTEFAEYSDERSFLPGIKDSKRSAIIVNAMLAQKICMGILQDPFFFLHSNQGMSSQLSDVYDHLRNTSREDGERWRATTLRLLRPQVSTQSTEAEAEIREMTESLIRKAASTYATDFLLGPVKVVARQDLDDKSQRMLHELFRDAAFLSYDLWTRNTCVECWNLKDVAEDGRFDVENPRMTPHALVRWEDAKDRLRDHEIKMLVHPLIVAFGTDEGEKYESARVWMPAEVWLPNEIPVKAEPQEKN